MYLPNAFDVGDEAIAFDLIEREGFGTLCSIATGSGDPVPVISHLPFLLDRDRRQLRAHMARANPHWQALEDNPIVTVVFNGAHGYISPAWYTVDDAVPTWNYETVHVRGRTTLVRDRERLRSDMLALVARFEGDGDDVWRAPLERADYRMRYEKMLDAIVGFEITIEAIQGKAKMSQNRSAADQRAVITGLKETKRASDRALAERMEFYRRAAHPAASPSDLSAGATR